MVTIGPCSDDLVRPQLKGGNLRALRDGRIALFPWRHAPSRVWGRYGDGAGYRYEQGALHWKNLCELHVEDTLKMIAPQMETQAVWLTIDKDVLAESEALTNWDQGQMPLASVLQIIAAIGARKRIAGADICGEFSASLHRNPFKRWEARMDQPQREADAALLARNEQTNRELLRAIENASHAC